MRRARDAILGLDLSTRAAAGIAIPRTWNGDWLKTRTIVIGEPLTKFSDDVDRALRTGSIAEQLCRFAFDYGVGQAWFESYAFGMKTSAHTLGELGGVVRLELARMGISIHTANMGTARKLIVGTVPRGTGVAKLASKLAFRALQAAGMPIRFGKKTELDETDAFVAANLGLAEAGCYCFAQRSPP